MAMSDFIVDVVISVVTLAIGQDIVAPYFATGGSLEAYASKWGTVITVIFASLMLQALAQVRNAAR